MTRTANRMWATLAVSALLAVSPVRAQKAYGPGASDTEIKLGQSTPLSGPASAFGAGAGRAVVGYFEMLNEQGGINGRKISFTQLDNAYSAPKAVEQSRRLVEDIGVLAEVGTIGTVPNVAIQKFLNSKQVPQLFITAGGRRFNDPKTFPWTVPLYPDFETEGGVIAKYILNAHPDAKIGVLYQNDDYGKDYVRGLRAGLGAKASQIIAEVSYELSDPTIDFANRSAQGGRRRHADRAVLRQGRGTIHPQGSRAELESAPHHRRVDSVGRDRAQTRRPRSVKRTGHDAISQAAGRPGVGQRRRDEGVQGISEEVRAFRQPGRLFRAGGLHECKCADDSS